MAESTWHTPGQDNPDDPANNEPANNEPVAGTPGGGPPGAGGSDPGGPAGDGGDGDARGDEAGGDDEDTRGYDVAELFGTAGTDAGASTADTATTDTGTTETGTDPAEADPAGDEPLPSGTVLGNRYRLEELLATAHTSITWRAFDLVLSRSVLIHLLPAGDERSADLLAAGRSAAGATDSRFLRILDAVEQSGTDSDGRPIGSYVVSEYAVGQTLRTVLSVAALTGLEAAWVIREVADALAGVHQQGLHHGLLNPDTVIITPSGNIKIGGLLIEAALSTGEPDDSEAPDGSAPGSGQQDDIAGLGKLLYACLVARWPGGPGFGFAAAPTTGASPAGNGHNWLTPRQVRHGVSPTLDRVCDQLLNPVPRQQSNPITDAAGLVGELDRVLGSADATGDLERRLRHPQPAADVSEPDAAPADTAPASAPPQTDPVTVALPTTSPEPPPTPSGPAAAETAGATRPPGRNNPLPSAEHPAAVPADRRRHRRCVPVLVVLLVVAAAIAVLLVRLFGGTGVGSAPSGSKDSPSSGSSPHSTTVKIVRGKDFDPQGDKSEKPGQVKNALDGNPKTQWHTLAYYGSPKFGNLKKGLGLVLDLGDPHRVRRVTVGLTGHGTSLQARVPKGDAAKVSSPHMNRARDWRPVARQQHAGSKAKLTFDKPVKTRFVLVYLTSLPKEDGHYRGGISQLTVRS